jgi:protein TonB
VTRGSQPNLERFMIVSEPRARAAPETTSLLDEPVPVAPAAPPPAQAAPTPPAPPKAATVTPIPGKPAEAKPAPKTGAAR